MCLWPLRAYSYMSRSLFNSFSTTTKPDAYVARRGPSFRDAQVTTAQDTARRPPPYTNMQVTSPRPLHQNGPPNKHAGFMTTTSINDRCQGNIDSFQINNVDSGTTGCQLTNLERRLSERHVEVRTLRETMERNEIAMLRVIDDRKRAWESELAQCRAQWEQSIQDHRDRCEGTEHLLKADIARLQRENASLRAGEEELEHELKTARTSVNRLCAELEYKHAEISELRAAIDKRQTPATHCACSVDIGNRRHAVMSSDDGATGTAVTQPPTHWEKVSNTAQIEEGITFENHHVDQVLASADEVCRLRKEIASVVNELDSTRQQFDEERRRWTMEKERVTTYQKLLQRNCVQMVQRCAALEMERHQLISQLAMAVPVQYTAVGGPDETTTVLDIDLGESQC